MKLSTHWTELLEELALQRQCLDLMTAGWIGEYVARGGVIHCARGCHACCSLAVNCTLTEAVALSATLSEAQHAAVGAYAVRLRELAGPEIDMKEYLRLQRREMGMCPLLAADGACGAYAARPLSCRALLSTRESYWCGVDFATLPADEKERYLASLDRSVTDFPLHYLASARETGRDFETRQLSHMGERLGYACYGCMPVLVHLVHGYALHEAASGEQAAGLVSEAGSDSPLLLTWLP